MKRTYLILALIVTIATVAAAVAVPMIEKGLASQAQTDSTGSLDVSLKVDAVDSSLLGPVISVPKPDYVRSQDMESYVPAEPQKSISGIMTIHASKADNYAQLRLIVDYLNRGSWIFIDTISITIAVADPTGVDEEDRGGTYVVYDSLTGTGVAGKPTNSIKVLKAGEYNFTLSVKYKSSIRIDPDRYLGDNMISKVTFIAKEVDPLNAKMVRFYSDENKTNSYDQIYYPSSTNLDGNRFTKAGYSFKEWSTFGESPKTYDDRDDKVSFESLPNLPNMLELYSEWSVNTLEVIYEVPEGQAPNQQSIEGLPDVEVSVKEPNTHVIENKYFRYWKDKDTGVNYHPGHDLRLENTNPEKTMTLTAVYELKYAITTTDVTGATCTFTGAESISNGVFEGDTIKLAFQPNLIDYGLKLSTLKVTYNDGSLKELTLENEGITQISTNEFTFTSVGYDMDVSATYAAKYEVTAGTIRGASLMITESFFQGDSVELSFRTLRDMGLISVDVYYGNTHLDNLDKAKVDSGYKVTFTAPASDVVVDAVFDLQYTITISDTPNGTVSVSTVGGIAPGDHPKAVAGANVVLSATPSSEYRLSSLTYTIDGQSPVVISECTFVMPSANVTINATFERDT